MLRPRSPHALRLVGACLLLAACTESGPNRSRGSACTTVAKVQCNKTLTCNLGFTDIEYCVRLLRERCCLNAGTCDDELTLEEDEAFATCSDDVRAQACANAATPPLSCLALNSAPLALHAQPLDDAALACLARPR